MVMPVRGRKRTTREKKNLNPSVLVLEGGIFLLQENMYTSWSVGILCPRAFIYIHAVSLLCFSRGREEGWESKGKKEQPRQRQRYGGRDTDVDRQTGRNTNRQTEAEMERASCG